MEEPFQRRFPVGGPQEFVRYWLVRRSCPINCALLRSGRAGAVAAVCGIARAAGLHILSVVSTMPPPSSSAFRQWTTMARRSFSGGAESVEAAILSAVEADPLEVDGRALDVLDIRLLHAARQ